MDNFFATLTCFFLSYRICKYEVFSRTCNFDKYKYELLECHIKHFSIGYCMRGFLPVALGCRYSRHAKIGLCKGFVNESAIYFIEY